MRHRWRLVAFGACLALGALCSSQAAAQTVSLQHDAISRRAFGGEARVSFFGDDMLARSESARHITERSLFGRRLEAREYAALVGAPRGARIDVTYEARSITLEVSHPWFKEPLRRVIARDNGGRLYIHNDGFILAPELAGRGLGLRILAHQVEGARRLGVRYLWCRATGVAGSASNGAYSWVVAGYNGLLPRAARAELPPSLSTSKDLLELVGRPEGRAWWRAHFRPVDVYLDLDPASRTSRAHAEQLLAKGIATARSGKVDARYKETVAALPKNPSGYARWSKEDLPLRALLQESGKLAAGLSGLDGLVSRGYRLGRDFIYSKPALWQLGWRAKRRLRRSLRAFRGSSR